LPHRERGVEPREIEMKRIQYDRYGGPEELKLMDVVVPEPIRNQIRVRVVAASVNPMDWKIRRGELKFMTGSSFPRGLGHDFAGVVEAVGPDAKDFKVGDEVFGATGLKEAGAFADVVIADAKTTFKKPASVPFDVAAALPIASFTAWHGLIDKAKLRAGQSVFVTGCLGAVGRAAVQLALMTGAVVDGSCSAAGREEALELGVREVVDYAGFNADRFRKRFDVVFDTAGALTMSECDGMLKQRGVALHIVITPAKMIRSLVSSRHKAVFGTSTPESAAGITGAAAQGKLVPKIARIVSLAEAIPTIVALETSGSPKGKIIIRPEG
jgi:NADPH:quinone reductase-like Zn-dependent oxidoreductase